MLLFCFYVHGIQLCLLIFYSFSICFYVFFYFGGLASDLNIDVFYKEVNLTNLALTKGAAIKYSAVPNSWTTPFAVYHFESPKTDQPVRSAIIVIMGWQA